MKYIFLAMFYFSFIFESLTFSQSSEFNLKNTHTSADLGVPKGFIGFGLVNHNNMIYWRMSGNIFSYPSDKKTYDFSPSRFDDEDRGKISTYVSFGGGKAFKLKKSNQIFLVGVQIGFKSEYYKKYDSSEILSDDGIYYVVDDKNQSNVYFSPNLGIMFPNANSKNGGHYSIGLELVPLNIYFGYAFKN